MFRSPLTSAMDGAPDAREDPDRAPRPAPAKHGVASLPLLAHLDHALTRTVALLNPFLLAQSLPSFIAQRAPDATLAVVSLSLAALPCVLVLVALAGRGAVARRVWLLVAGSGYLAVAGLERSQAAAAMPVAYLPWLLTVAPLFIACFALGARHVITWVLGTLLATAAVIDAYASRLPLDRLAMTIFGLALFSAGAFWGVRSLRSRAVRAEAAQRDASAKYDESQRRIALEEERTRTDALLHDALLNALLIAAAATAPRARSDAARGAEQAISALDDRLAPAGAPDGAAPEESTLDSLERELAPVQDLVRLDLSAARDARVPGRVLEALAAATLQAVNNSLKHAGADADRLVRAEPLPGGGIRVTVLDDGRGFDPTGIDPERLGVRVSVMGRMQSVGGTASVRSAPGAGTTVVIGWSPVLVEEVAEAGAGLVHA